MAQQGIYVSPDNIVPNRDRGNKQNLYLYVCKYNNSTESSRELGFNAVERCKYCGKPATHEELCEKCYNMRHR